MTLELVVYGGSKVANLGGVLTPQNSNHRPAEISFLWRLKPEREIYMFFAYAVLHNFTKFNMNPSLNLDRINPKTVENENENTFCQFSTLATENWALWPVLTVFFLVTP